MNNNDDALKRFKEQVLKEGPRLGTNDTIQFGCHSGLACFNRCCHDVNILLTPYDIIRMKKSLGISSGDFLDRYCLIPFSKELKYPIVLLKMGDDAELSCPFLDPSKGCSIYKDRPWACRMYPLGRAAPPPEAGSAGTFYFLMQEDICEGFQSPQARTIAQWLSDQGVEAYDRAGRSFQAVVQHEGLSAQSELAPEKLDMLFMVCYDLDRFRRFVFDSKFLTTFEISAEQVEAIRTDDVALMEFGFQWIRFALWREPTLTIREDVLQTRREHLGVH